MTRQFQEPNGYIKPRQPERVDVWMNRGIDSGIYITISDPDIPNKDHAVLVRVSMTGQAKTWTRLYKFLEAGGKVRKAVKKAGVKK
jgi:hypothetical protein